MTDVPENGDAPVENGTSPGSTVEDKGHTFRKRRLSLTNFRQYDATPSKDNNEDEATPTSEKDEQVNSEGNNVPPAASGDNPATAALTKSLGTIPAPSTPSNDQINSINNNNEDEKAHSFRKRRLSLTHNREDPSTSYNDQNGDTVNDNNKRRRRASDASAASIDSSNTNGTRQQKQQKLKSRILHASELLAQQPSPRSSSIQRNASLQKLYTQSAPPQQQPLLDTIEQQGLIPVPKWFKRRTRHLHEDETTLPFPRDIVGIYSCHGVEPIYDEDYHSMEDNDDDDDDPWVMANKNATTAAEQNEKPTMAAKINQDRGGVAFPYGNCSRTALFAVYDGHGQGGELVSQFALHEVQRRLEKHPDFTADIEKAFKETFIAVDEALETEELIEPVYAGTTACVALLRENQLVLANSGDSRAVLARKLKVGDGYEWNSVDLTIDQNPDLPEEQARIEDMGGYVSPPPEPGLSARVWLDVDCTQIGLAMARSIGDHAVKQIGVIAEPVVSFHDISPLDDFVIFATDGVWEFVSSDEAVKIVAENLEGGATKACQALIEAAAAKWHDEEGDYRDDITALVVRLQYLWDSNNQSKDTSAKNSK